MMIGKFKEYKKKKAMRNNAYPFIGAMRADDGYAGTLWSIKNKKTIHLQK